MATPFEAMGQHLRVWREMHRLIEFVSTERHWS
jgi:hypothetical protein